MNESENKFENAPGTEMSELRLELDSLRSMLSASLLLLFIFSACVNLYLFHQASAVHAQASQANQLVYDFDHGGSALIVDFWTKLNDYSRTHPDFAPVFNKYSKFINTRPNPAAAPKKK
jgi:hypothetical protein